MSLPFLSGRSTRGGMFAAGPAAGGATGVTPASNTYSVDFTGADDYMAADSAATALRGLSVSTINLWAKAAAYSNLPATFAVYTDTDASTGFYFYTHQSAAGSTGKCKVYWGGGTIAPTADFARKTGWDMYSWVSYAADDHKLFVNGVHLSSSTSSITFDSGLNAMDVGGASPWSQMLNGHVDEVGIWSSALTAAELLAAYNEGVPIDLQTDGGDYESSSTLLNWWRMGDDDGGTGTSVTDKQSGKTGTLTNGPPFAEDVP